MPSPRRKKKKPTKKKNKNTNKDKNTPFMDNLQEPRPERFDGHGFRRLVPPTTTLPGAWTRISASFILKDAFRLRTLLATGAALQMGFSAAVKQPWCFLPAAALLTLALSTTLFQLALPLLQVPFRRRHSTATTTTTHAFLAGVLPGRSTAQLPSATTGRYGPGAGGAAAVQRPLVVFHFGARFNHPLGLLAPGGRKMTMLFRATIAALQEDRDGGGGSSEYGLLGANLFRGGERASNDTILLVMYFRDVEGLQRFAGSPEHERAYTWLRTAGHAHISAFHETFCVPSGAYETLYINTAPILLGNTYTQDDEEERDTIPAEEGREGSEAAGEEEGHGEGQEEGQSRGAKEETVWLNSLLDADDVRLRTMAARLKHKPF